jgi:acetyl/propionyl-CoA carboxylase alpha subunit
MVVGVDLVVEQIRVAAGLPLSPQFEQLSQRGHAIECRLYAEDGDNNFMPSTGRILHYSEPSGPGVRVDSGIMKGMEITIDYDPIMAKLIVHAPDRASAITKMIDALNNYKILGVKTSKKFMIDCLRHREFAAGNTFTSFIETHMGDRQTGPTGYRKLAAAVAAVSSMSAPTAVAVGGGGSGELPTPWQIIGQWQIGDSING